jgi:hypothetical protein
MKGTFANYFLPWASYAAQGREFLPHLTSTSFSTPQVFAKITKVIGFAGANSAAAPLLDAWIAADPIIQDCAMVPAAATL